MNLINKRSKKAPQCNTEAVQENAEDSEIPAEDVDALLKFAEGLPDSTEENSEIIQDLEAEKQKLDKKFEDTYAKQNVFVDKQDKPTTKTETAQSTLQDAIALHDI